MRIIIRFKGNGITIPSNNQHIVNSYIHRCLGENNKYHNTNSDYCISPLRGGVIDKKAKTVTIYNAYIVVTTLDKEFLSKIIVSTLDNELCDGITLAGIDPIQEEFLNGWNHFKTLSPFIMKNKDDTLLDIADVDFVVKVKYNLINIISKINPSANLSDFDVQIPDRFKHNKKMKMHVMYNAIHCQIDIHCNKEIAELIYSIGIGKSTGSGFGTIYKTENAHMYK